MSDQQSTEQEINKTRFLSLQWKSISLYFLIFSTLLSLLCWHFYEQYQRDFSTKLNEIRYQQLEQLETTVYRSGEQLRHIINSTILSKQSQSDHDINVFRKRVEDILPNLAPVWTIDEAAMIKENGSVLFFYQTDKSKAEFILPWTKQQTGSLRNGLSKIFNTRAMINIVCERECRQILLIPILENNSRIASIIISRDLASLQQEFFQHSNSQLLLFQQHNAAANTNDSDSSSAMATEIPKWKGTIINKLSSETHDTLLVASQHFLSVNLFGFSRSFEFDKQRYSLSFLPIRGYDDFSLHYILLRNIDDEYAQLIQNLIQEIVVVACLFAIFTLYIFTLNWRYLRRVKQQIEVLPLLGQNQFHEAREIVNKNRGQNFLRDELDILDDSVTTLSYQLESLEKAVSLRTREMERLSLFDTLTGLANRNLLQYELQSDVQRYFQQGGVLAIVMLDLDKFKRINDSIGHQQGDVLLGKVAARLKNATRSLGLVARLGGDEFAIILRSAKKYQQVESLCHKILELVHRPIEIDDHSIAISCSLGVSLASKDYSSNDMIKNAEIAMYKAKEIGGNAYKLFDASMATEAHANLSLEADIRRAFENREFTLFLQPKVNMDSNIEGFESLIRWDHPDRGLVPPVEFIPAMENMGLISRLDNFVLDASCRQLKILQNHYPDVSIAVNISSTHFTDKNFLIFLKNCLDKYPINPNLLELEITETLLMENMNVGMEIIEQIKELGVRIAIDDFGTGYSSLSYLKKLPVDTIKIDREFIKDIPESESDMQISSVIIFLAKQLNFTVVAEGVETSEQLVFLKANQCDLAQGFYFSKPIPAHKAMLLLESQLGGKKLGFG